MTESLQNLGPRLVSGRTLRARGTVSDAAGRPVGAVVAFRAGGRALGYVPAPAGRWGAYDLPTGPVTAIVNPMRGEPKVFEVSIPAAGIPAFTFRV